MKGKQLFLINKHKTYKENVLGVARSSRPWTTRRLGMETGISNDDDCGGEESHRMEDDIIGCVDESWNLGK